MLSIPCVIPYHEDELLASWLFRLATENCFTDYLTFLGAYVYPNVNDLSYSSLKKDLRIPFELFWRALPHDVVDERTLFFNTSIFTSIAPFMTKEQRQRYVNCAFNTNKSLKPLFPDPHSSTSGFLICPECAKSELGLYGYFYLHRSHHIPGVTVCHVHNCPLGRISTRIDKLSLNSVPEYSPIALPETNRNLEYAIFAKNFLDAEVDCDVDDVLRLFKQKRLSSLSEEMTASGYAALARKGKGANPLMMARQYVAVQSCLASLLYLYKNIDGVKNELAAHPVELDKWKHIFDADGYSLTSTYRNDILCLKHKQCGQTFCTSAYGYRIGWRCPVCDRDLPLQEKYRAVVDAVGDGVYAPVTPFQGMNKKVTLLHKSCGKQMSVVARSFLYDGVRCDCERRVDFQAAKNNVEQYDGFQLLSYERTDRPITVKHSCGGTFEIYYKKFMDAPRCRVCERKGHLQVRTAKDFEEDLFDLVGNEYSLVGEYNAPHEYLTIRHNKCGRTQHYRPYYFLDGGRCQCCHIETTEDEFTEFVVKYSKGRYVIKGKSTKNLYKIEDCNTGESVAMSKLKILQELQRPTPSPVLPLNERDNTVSIQKIRNLRKQDVVMSWLQNNRFFQMGEPIFMEDVAIDGLTGEEVQQTLSNLAKRGKLTHLTTGVYALPNTTIQNDQIISAKYLIRQGKHIGFLRGAFFARRLGLTTVDRPEWSVATNKESCKTPNRKTKLLGVPIHIKGMPVVINDDNYLTLSVTDFLIQYKQCTDAPLERVLQALRDYIKYNNDGEMLPYSAFDPIVESYSTANIKTLMRRLIAQLCEEERNASDLRE